ncbi:MAG: putative ABC exporter domain-containing protein [Tepidisphaerales bacterium]
MSAGDTGVGGFGPGGPLPVALRKLLWMHVRGFWRRLFRNARTPKGMVLTAVGAVLAVIWLVPMVLGVMFSRRPGGDPEALARWLPMGMLGMCVVTAVAAVGGRPVTFTPAETDFLFPGPFSRKQILLYRLTRTALGALFGTVLVSLAFGRRTGSPVATFVPFLLMLLFLQFFGTACTQVGHLLAAKVSGLWQRVTVGVVLAGLVLAGLLTAPIPAPPTRPAEAMGVVVEKLTQLRDSAVMGVVTLPFAPYAMAVAPIEGWLRVLWTLAAAAVTLGMLGLCLRLDADYLEVSATAARRRAEAAQKAMRRGVAYEVTSTGLRCPRLPRWGGAGAVIWCQMTTGLRAVWKILVLMLVAAGGLLGVIAWRGVSDLTGPVMAMLVMVTLMGGGLFRFDFRSEVDRLDTLKLLPVRSWVLAAGQLATPVVLIGGLQWLLAGVLLSLRPERWELAASVAAFGPAVALLMVGIENIAFLLVPSRVRTVTPGDLTAVARASLVFLAKMTSLATVLGLAVVAGLGVRWLTGWAGAGLLVAWAVAAGACLAVVPVAAWAFDRLDVAEDAAPNS